MSHKRSLEAKGGKSAFAQFCGFLCTSLTLPSIPNNTRARSTIIYFMGVFSALGSEFSSLWGAHLHTLLAVPQPQKSTYFTHCATPSLFVQKIKMQSLGVSVSESHSQSLGVSDSQKSVLKMSKCFSIISNSHVSEFSDKRLSFAAVWHQGLDL